jgi:hypothetical protein
LTARKDYHTTHPPSKAARSLPGCAQHSSVGPPSVSNGSGVPSVSSAPQPGGLSDSTSRLEGVEPWACRTSKTTQTENEVFYRSAYPILVVDNSLLRLKRMRSTVRVAAKLLEEESRVGGFRGRVAFLTLTYRDQSTGWCPGQLAAFVDRVRHWMRRRGHPLRYVDVGELMEHREADAAHCVHYHLLVWVPRGLSLPKPDKQGWWPHGSTKIETARNPVAYITKYASKGTGSKKFPRGMRIHGSGGLSKQSRLQAAWWKLPKYVREKFTPFDRPRRVAGGGFSSPVTGEWIASPWVILSRSVDWKTIHLVERTAFVGRPPPVLIVS